MAEVEVIKLQKHLTLLREEYVKLQNKYTELERKYNVLNSITIYSNKNNKNSNADPHQDPEDNYISRLLKTISELFDKDLYSDLKILLNDGKVLRAHKFVLDARSKNWNNHNLSILTELDLSDIPQNIGYRLIKWVYTDTIVDLDKSDEDFYLAMMKQADRFHLKELKLKCEDGLLAFVNVRNCIKFYEVADQISALTLKNHCNELISAHWDDFTSDDFAHMPASLLFQMFKAKTRHPLHAAIKARREDVVFLYFIENDAALHIKLNEPDEKNDLPLDLALKTQQTSIADYLVKSHVDLNKVDINGLSLLHKAVLRSDVYAAEFLVDNNINVNLATHADKKTALMYLAASSRQESEQMLSVVQKILMLPKIDVNLQDVDGNTALHVAVRHENTRIFKDILMNKSCRPNLSIRNNEGETVLWLALVRSEEATEGCEQAFESAESFPSLLIGRNCEVNTTDSSGDSILHLCARQQLEKAAVFLVEKKAKINVLNCESESVLHLACENGLGSLVAMLLKKEADPNVQTSELTNSQTPMHKAILNNHEEILELFIRHKETMESSSQAISSFLLPDFNILDANGQSVLSLCLWNNSLDLAKKLIDHNADKNITDNDAVPLLHQAILRQCTDAALFLLDQEVDIDTKATDEGLTPLQLAVKRHLPLVVENLCLRGTNMSVLDSEGNSPLWTALDTGQEDVATILVKNKCDTTQWGTGPEMCQQSLLHRAIDENNDAVAVFLIKSGCDLNSPRRPGINGEAPEEATDGMTPLHLSCSFGQEKVVVALVSHLNCLINKQDAMGNTPLHVAIENQHQGIIEVLIDQAGVDLRIKNQMGQTPFATALERKNNKAASWILKKEPNAAEQFDNKGRNFLHTAVGKSDIETVLSLLSVNVNVNSRTNDSLAHTPLHLAVMVGSEIILRNLLLAGSKINDLAANKKSALHMIAECKHESAVSICMILLENGIDFNALDSFNNNALHIAVQHSNLPVIKVLLASSDIEVYSLNGKGMSPLHMLGSYGKENSSAILDLFKEHIPNFDLDQKDAKGNSTLLLSYQNGNGILCRSLIKYGAAIGTYNDDGISIFNHPVATKQLMFKLLDILNKESPWVEADFCLECNYKFSITNRKHHCRHCGRVLCKKCSEKEISILKFSLQKPVRVCDICFDVLTAGGQNI